MAEPTVPPTAKVRLAVVAAVGALAAVLVKLAFDRTTGSAPSPGPAAIWIGFLALLTGLVAVTARRRIQRARERVEAEQATRWLALAKTSSFGGALFAGLFAAYAAASTGHIDTVAGGPRFWWSLVAAVASTALLLAGLWLERNLRIPPHDDDEPPAPPSDPAAPASL